MLYSREKETPCQQSVEYHDDSKFEIRSLQGPQNHLAGIHRLYVPISTENNGERKAQMAQQVQ